MLKNGSYFYTNHKFQLLFCSKKSCEYFYKFKVYKLRATWLTKF